MSFVRFVLRFLTVASFPSSMKFIEYISKTYFSGESLLFIYWSNVSVEFRDELLDYWMKSEIVTVETCNCDRVTDEIIWEKSYVKNIVVLFGDLVPERRHIESIRQCRAWNARSKVLAVVNDSDDIANVTLRNIWTFTKAFNATVMVSSTSSVGYYTLYPYENFKIVQIDKTGLFPPKPLNNLHGSVVSIATTFTEPYIILPKIPNDYKEGLEIRIINTISKKFNFRINYLIPPNGQSPWTSLTADRRKAIGNFGLMHRCEADILFHGIPPSFERCTVGDLTTVHTIDRNVWTVPVRPFSFNWRSIVRLFKKELWGLIWLTLSLIAVMLYLIIKYDFNSSKTSYNAFDAFFQAFGIHLGVPIYFYRERQLYRLFVFTVSYYTMIIMALYQSSLITHLTSPGSEDQYHTIEEVLEDGLVAEFFYASKPLLNITDHDLWNRVLAPGKHVYTDNAYRLLLFMAHLNKTIYSFLNYNFANFIIHRDLLDENHEPMVRMLPEDYNKFMIAMFTSKGHPLRRAIENDLLRLNEAGILEQWMKEILKDVSAVGVGGQSNDEDDGATALTFEHLKGAFYILPVMLCVGMVTFIGEVVWFRCKKRKVEKNGGFKRCRTIESDKMMENSKV